MGRSINNITARLHMKGIDWPDWARAGDKEGPFELSTVRAVVAHGPKDGPESKRIHAKLIEDRLVGKNFKWPRPGGGDEEST